MDKEEMGNAYVKFFMFLGIVSVARMRWLSHRYADFDM